MNTMKAIQAEAILNTLETWCAAKPGRRIIIGRTELGWKAALDTHLPASGESLSDALAQIATVAALEAQDG